MRTLSLRAVVVGATVVIALMWAAREANAQERAQEQEADTTRQPAVADDPPAPIAVYYVPRYYMPRYYIPRYYTPWVGYYGPVRTYYGYWPPPAYHGAPVVSYDGRDYVRPVYPYRWRRWRDWRRLEAPVPPPY